MNANSFAALNLKPELLANLETMGFATMTPIQAQSLPAILKGQDVIGQAKQAPVKPLRLVLGYSPTSM